MPARRLLNQRCAKHLLSRSFPFPVGPRASWLVVALFITPLVIPLHAQQKTKLPRPRRLDEDLALRRDPATGELTSTPAAGSAATNANKDATSTRPIAVVTQIVPVMCNVVGADGAAVGGLQRDDFRVFDDGAPQSITYFDASTESASVALVLDASPSVLRESDEMKNAARALVDALSSSDQTAVVDFSAHTYLQLPFSNDWALIRKAVARVDARALLGDVGGSNIYEAVFLTARELFANRTGRKAIVLLTDGQDSELGLTLDPATAGPRKGWPADRLTFEDVERTLATADIQVFVVSTESRPKVMTADWVAAHASQTLLNYSVRDSGIPAYTLYLAELAQRSGGQLYFLREAETLADTFRQIALRIRAEYTLGFSPAANATAAPHSGWHQLRVAVIGHGDPTVVHRASYYVPAAR
ncbi:MAG: VWA domain-containing protein [Candidatus Acidiferrales bacterium]